MTKLLKYMTWEEAKKEFESTKVAIIPVGSTEQHGPHMPLGTDFIIADYIANEVASKTNVIVTPVVPVGFAAYHQDFNGSLSIDIDILAKYYEGIAESLITYGITHILFMNGHGGNTAALNMVCRKLRDRGITAAHMEWWMVTGNQKKEWAMLGHGDIIETSMMLYLTKEHVHLDRANIPVNKNLTDRIKILDGSACEYKGGVVNFYLRMGEVTDTGDMLEIGHSKEADYTISPRDSTPELGKELLDFVIDYTVDFLEEFKKVNFNK